MESSAYANGIFLAANGRRYSAAAEHERLRGTVVGADVRTACAEHHYDVLLSDCDDTLQSDADACRIGFNCDKYRGFADNFQETN